MPNQLVITTPQAAQWATPSGNKSIGPNTLSGGLGLAETFDIQPMASGDNIIAIPATSTGCLIYPPSGNTTPLTVRTVVGDTGIRINKTFVTTIVFDTTALPANVYVNSTGGFAGVLEVIFF